MPHLVKPWITSYVDADGRRCPAGTAGAKPSRSRARKWYGVGIPGLPSRKRVPLAANRGAAQRMLDDIIRAAEQGEARLPDQAAGKLELARHLDDFEKDIRRGTATRSKRKRPPDPAQAKLVAQRVRSVLSGCGFEYPSDLNAAATGKLADYLQSRLKLERKEGGLSHQSAAFHLAAARRFTWWLSRKRVSVRADLFDDVPGFEPSANRVHQRREIQAEELARLLEAALADTRADRRGLTGRDRYHLYLTAFATGFRAGELAALTKDSFRLDAEPPVVTLAAKLTKAKRAATIPLPPAVAAQMRSYLAEKCTGPVWPGSWSEKPVAILKRDLRAAGVPYEFEGEHGKQFADFHALRHSFVSALARAGVGPKELQELARHTDPRLTLGLYTHSSQQQLAGAVSRLPLPGAKTDPLEAMSRDQLLVALRASLALAEVFLGASGGASKTREVISVNGTTENDRG